MLTLLTTLRATVLLVALASPPGSAATGAPRVRAEPPMCLPTQVTFPADATGPMPDAITIRFVIAADGGAKDVSVGFPVGAPVSEMLVEAAKSAVEHCTWVPEEGGSADPSSRSVALRLPVVPAPTDRRGLTSPKMVDVDCFRSTFNLVTIVPKQRFAITAKFPVFADGKPGRARLLEKFDDPAIQDQLERSVTVAVRSCEWVPGKDAGGRPTLVWVVLPIRIQ